MGMNDIQLVKSCLRGEAEEFQKIVDRYGGKLMALALNVLGNCEDAEDTCQDAFIQAFRNLGTFDTQKSFRNWLYTILYNRCRDQLRKRQRFRSFFKKAKKEYYPVAGAHSLDLLKKASLPQAILAKLNPRERAVLSLWAVEGYTSKEIGEVLHCSPSTARVHLYKARKKLKSLLERQNVSM